MVQQSRGMMMGKMSCDGRGDDSGKQKRKTKIGWEKGPRRTPTDRQTDTDKKTQDGDGGGMQRYRKDGGSRPVGLICPVCLDSVDPRTMSFTGLTKKAKMVPVQTGSRSFYSCPGQDNSVLLLSVKISDP